MGNTALVTGASSGIGTELAKYHASKGGDVVLVARSEDKLNELKAELESDHGISATVIVSDLAQPPDAAGKIFSATETMGLQIDVLIDNAGFGRHGKFHERGLAKDQALAEHYLARSAISPPEISFLLGYQDNNSFLRAFIS